MQSQLPTDKIIQLYQNGATSNQLAIKFDCHHSTILRLLQRHNIPRRSISYRKYSLEIPDFENLLEIDYYWLGFLLADGCVSKGQLIVHLASRDIEHLEKMKQWLRSEHKITRPTVTSARISVSSKELVSRLAQFGIVERKSLIANVSDVLKNSRHFWRGMIDGDGHIAFRKDGYWTIQLVGTKQVCESFSDFVHQVLNVRYNTHERKGQNHHITSITGKRARVLIEHLYNSATIYLDRKLGVVKR